MTTSRFKLCIQAGRRPPAHSKPCTSKQYNQAPPAPSGSGKKQKSRGNNGSVQKKGHERRAQTTTEAAKHFAFSRAYRARATSAAKGKPGAAKPQAPPTTADRLEQPEEGPC